MEVGQWCVYMHTFPNGKKYVGITSQGAERRWRKNGEGYKSQEMLTHAIAKYGWENIKHEILANNVEKAEAEKLEIYYIRKFGTTDRKRGYNIESGGECATGYKLSEKTRAKMSATRKGKNNWLYGKHLSLETKEKLRIAHLGKKQSQEAIIKSVQKRSGGNAHNARKVDRFDLNGVFIKTYDCLADGGRDTNTRVQDIYNCCKGRQKRAHGNIWRYHETNEPVKD